VQAQVRRDGVHHDRPERNAVAQRGAPAGQQRLGRVRPALQRVHQRLQHAGHQHVERAGVGPGAFGGLVVLQARAGDGHRVEQVGLGRGQAGAVGELGVGPMLGDGALAMPVDAVPRQDLHHPRADLGVPVVGVAGQLERSSGQADGRQRLAIEPGQEPRLSEEQPGRFQPAGGLQLRDLLPGDAAGASHRPQEEQVKDHDVGQPGPLGRRQPVPLVPPRIHQRLQIGPAAGQEQIPDATRVSSDRWSRSRSCRHASSRAVSAREAARPTLPPTRSRPRSRTWSAAPGASASSW
jgi:hypothetical protein